MTSKISFSKLLKEDIRHRGWLAALSCILLLSGQTVYTLLSLENQLSGYSSQNYTMIQSIFPGMLNGSHTWLLAGLLFLLAVLCAATGFSYLHTPEKVDFYHSLPLKRMQWFRVSYTGGLLIFLVPYLVSSFCTLLAGSVKGIMNSEVLFYSCIAVLGGILAFLVIYHTTIFAMMLTGKIVTGILAALVLSYYGTMICKLLSGLTRCFFDTYYYNSVPFTSILSGYASPSVLFFNLLNTTAANDLSEETAQSGVYLFVRLFSTESISGNLLLLLVLILAFLAVSGVLSVLLYQKRRSEAAGNALAFPKTAPLIKVLIAVPTSLYIGLFTNYLFSSSRKWVILVSIVSVFLLCGIIEFIYHMDLRRLLAGKYSSLAAICGVIAILCILHFDLVGYDSWLPEEQSLESMSFYTDSISGYFSYPTDSGYSSYMDLLEEDACQVADFAPLYGLAQEGIANTEAGITADTVYAEDSSYDYINISLRFNEKRGKTSYRSYAVRRDHMLEALSALCQDEDYRKALFPVFYLDYDNIIGIQLNDIYDQPASLELTREQQDALLDAYKKDVLAVDSADLQAESPLGELFVEVPDTNLMSTESYQYKEDLYTWTITQFYLYESYENTLRLLDEYGYSLRTEINPDDVSSMIRIETLSEGDVDQNGNVISDYLTSNEYPVTDPDEIKEILSQIRYYCNGILGGLNLSSQSVELQLKGETDKHYYALP